MRLVVDALRVFVVLVIAAVHALIALSSKTRIISSFGLLASGLMRGVSLAFHDSMLFRDLVVLESFGSASDFVRHSVVHNIERIDCVAKTFTPMSWIELEGGAQRPETTFIVV